VRLGSTRKATIRTQALSLHQARLGIKLSREQHDIVSLMKSIVSKHCKDLDDAFDAFRQSTVSKSEIFEYLEFQSGGPGYFDALSVPQEDDNMTRMGRKGKKVDQFYLLDRWFRGKDAGMFKRDRETKFKDIWSMPPSNRMRAFNEWKDSILKDRMGIFSEASTRYNECIEQINAILMEKDLRVIRQKRVIACTTTAAAKFAKILQSIAPGVVLVEEAGEILESHILTALTAETKQLIMIGDHKQLRPKVHYDLSVEKGDGYDLNRSLFERLILRNYPHQVLFQQHRMRPEISSLVRELTYPDLIDAPKTRNRADLRGFRDNLIFVNHEEHEIDMENVPDLRDTTIVSSKKNLYEAKVMLKCVRYLAQQGYRTDNIVVLTPYLGQLRLLLDELGKENDPVLNDLDSYDLVRAGLMPQATASVGKSKIRISTIGESNTGLLNVSFT
jgi:AAA domain